MPDGNVAKPPPRTSWLVVLAAVLFLGGLGLRFLVREWSWGHIGGIIELVAILFLLLRDRIHAYGAGHISKADSEAGLRPYARAVHPYVYAIGVPLALLGALLQIVGGPNDLPVLRATRIPADTVYTPSRDDRAVLDLDKLNQALTRLDTDMTKIEGELEQIVCPKLLVVNCGTSAECQCPERYSRVEDIGGWNLNSGAGGDLIVLCGTE